MNAITEENKLKSNEMETRLGYDRGSGMYAQLDGRDENQSRPVRVETKIFDARFRSLHFEKFARGLRLTLPCFALYPPFLYNILSHTRARAHTHR